MLGIEIWLPHLVTVLVLLGTFVATTMKQSAATKVMLDNVAATLSELRDAIKELRDDFKKLRSEFSEHEKVDASVHEKVNNISDRIDDLEAKRAERERTQSSWRNW